MATFSLTAAQIKASAQTPRAIVPAPGAGKLIVPSMIVTAWDAGAVPYTEATVAAVLGTQLFSTFFTRMTSAVDVVQMAFSSTTGGYTPASVANQPLSFQANLAGPIVSATVHLGGADYVVGDTGTINDGTPLATYIVTAVNAGAVTAFTITSAGGGYFSDTNEPTTAAGAQPGIGTGFEVLITAVNASGAVGDGTMTGSVYYVVNAV